MLEEKRISELIIQSFFKKLQRSITADVIVVGGGPSGLVASYFLARAGLKTVLVERKGSLGGGIWGGGMMFNTIVLQKNARTLLDEFGVTYTGTHDGYFMVSAPEIASALIMAVCRANVEILSFMTAEDVMVRGKRISGLVVNWTAVEKAGLHVDPLTLEARYVVDATGHDHSVCTVVMKKTNKRLPNKMTYPLGEKGMHAELGENEVVRNSKELFPGLYITGMAANAVCGGHRMGPIFGGMLLSGEKVARDIIRKCNRQQKTKITKK